MAVIVAVSIDLVISSIYKSFSKFLSQHQPLVNTSGSITTVWAPLDANLATQSTDHQILHLSITGDEWITKMHTDCTALSHL